MEAEESNIDEFTRFTFVSSESTNAFERCPLCHSNKSPFTCRSCIRKGEFTSWTKSDSEEPAARESYAEKLQKYQQLKKTQEDLKKRLSAKISEDILARDRNEAEITELMDRIGLRREYLEEEKQQIKKGKEDLKQLRRTIDEKRKKAKVHQQKMDKISRYTGQLKKNLSVLQSKLEEKEQKLCDLRRKSLHHLTHYLFPITYITRSDDGGEEAVSVPQTTPTSDPEEATVVAKLAEARRTSFVRGRWVYADDSQESQYSIVHRSASLPANGEYSAFTAWIISQEDPYTNLELHNPGHQTIGALSYVTQLTQHLSWYFGIPLPKKLPFSYFCLKELGLKEFSCAVEKLNINILYLCCTQGVDPDVLHPHSPLNNLMQLTKCNSSLFGRSLPFEIYPDLFLVEMTPPSSSTSLVSSTSNLLLPENNGSDSPSSEDESEMEKEWETVPELDVSLIPSDTSVSTTEGAVSLQAGGNQEEVAAMGASNMTQAAGSLVSSAATVASALWRVASRQYDQS